MIVEDRRRIIKLENEMSLENKILIGDIVIIGDVRHLVKYFDRENLELISRMSDEILVNRIQLKDYAVPKSLVMTELNKLDQDSISYERINYMLIRVEL